MSVNLSTHSEVIAVVPADDVNMGAKSKSGAHIEIGLKGKTKGSGPGPVRAGQKVTFTVKVTPDKAGSCLYFVLEYYDPEWGDWPQAGKPICVRIDRHSKASAYVRVVRQLSGPRLRIEATFRKDKHNYGDSISSKVFRVAG